MRPAALSSLVAFAVLGAAGCYEAAPAESTFPEQHATWQGPPGGEMDPGWSASAAQPAPDQVPAPEAPGYPGYPAGYPDGSYPPADGSDPAGAEPQPSGDPADPGYVMGDVTDSEIDTTLAPYGQWVETEDYGRVWRPDATVVGADFTPYETDGSWLYTDYGWTFSCGYDWGWLPFHYGRWAYLDDASWGWVPDYTWGPAWVEWRHGGDYVGWRPLSPSVRDHRTGRGGRGDQRPDVRDHRAHGDEHWRFTTASNLGRGNVHDHLVPAGQALAATTIVPRPPVRGDVRVSAADVMRGRLDARVRGGQGRAWTPSAAAVRGGRIAPSRAGIGAYSPPARYPAQRSNPPARYPAQRYNPGAYNPPARYPTQRYNPGAYNPPARYPAPSAYRGGSYAPPSRSFSGGSYAPPSRSFNGGSYAPPSRSSSPSYAPPSRSSSPSYAPPSRSSSSGSSSSSHTGGGGGGRRR